MHHAGSTLCRLCPPLGLLAALAVVACAESAGPGLKSAGAAPRAETAAPEAPDGGLSPVAIRQGPMRVTCYKDDTIVFEHGSIYRVFRPDGEADGWSYETGDGLKFRGRIGENVNCVWLGSQSE